MNAPRTVQRSAWAWIPSLYFVEGIPYVVAMTMSVVLYKRLGISNTDIALYTSWLYLPWVVKPLWSPIVEMLGTKRNWIVLMQLLIGAALGCVALSLPGPAFFKITLGFFWLLAFSSATHDIAADGFYMLAMDKHQQAWFVGVRSTFYRLAMIAGQGLLIMLAGALETRTGLPALEMKLEARPEVVATAFADPAALPPAATLPGPLRLIATPDTITLNTAPTTPDDVSELLNRARGWNQTRGFTEPPEPEKKPDTPAPEMSWWESTVATPLTDLLRTQFGPETPVTDSADAAGQVGAFLIRLSGSPEKDVVVNVGRKSGDRGMKLLEGSRFVLNTTNWNQHMMVVVQLDPKNSVPTEARFLARAGNIPLAWAITFYTLSGMFLMFCLYHRFALPKPAADGPSTAGGQRNLLAGYFGAFGSFFRKPLILRALAFLLLYRLAESQLVKIASLFLLDARETGGLALSTAAVGFVYGTVGVAALTVGGLLGGFAAAKHGLKFWLPLMVCAINLPNLVYVYLSLTTPESFFIINVCVAIEQFGYGFGFAAYMIYMLYLAQGEHRTAHYAICTGFMALGMMIPGMFSGWLQETIGYQHFFFWVMLCTIPGFIVTALIKPDPGFGRKGWDPRSPSSDTPSSEADISR